MDRTATSKPSKSRFAARQACGNGRSILGPRDWDHVRAELGLSRRELELVQHIFDGGKLSAIAAQMKLALGTVKTYNQRIYAKLAVRDHRELTLVIVNSYLRLLRAHE